MPTFVHADDIHIDALVSGCGDGIVSLGEECDTNNLNGKSCSLVGFSNGTLTCTASCLFNTTQCTTQSGGGGGGGGGGSNAFSSAHIALTGGTAPQATVYILADGVRIATTTADNRGGFNTTVHTPSGGNYRLGIYTVDTSGNTTDMLTFFLRVPSRGTVRVDNLFVGPSIVIDKKVVAHGDTLTLSGSALPQATIETIITVASGTVYRATTTSNADGLYTLSIPTASFAYATHTIYTRVLFQSLFSAPSLTLIFSVGTMNVYADTPTKCDGKGDINGDCRVNLTDFSILLYWFNLGTPDDAFSGIEQVKLSGDGKINIVDVSIMFAFWTG